MSGNFIMALVTWKPIAAALELQRDDVSWTVIMRAARFWIDIDAVDSPHHVAARSRGQIKTSSEPIIQHAIITTKPALNEPVR